MRKLFRKISALVLASAILVALLPGFESKAASSGAVNATVTFRITGDTLFIEGTGEIPDYIGTAYLQRPWNGQYYTKVNIAPTITRVGQYAFANNPDLKWVDIYSTTFVKNNTCFTSADYDCIYRIHGDVPMYETLGNITYNSWDSIVAGSNRGRDSIFILDNSAVATNFRSLSYPYYLYAYPVTDPDAPWFTRTTYFATDAFNNVCHLENADSSEGLSFIKEPASESFMVNMGNFTKLFNYNYLASYKSYFFEKGTYMLTASTKTRKLVLNLDAQFQAPGVSLKLLQICPDGTLFIYDDLDTNLKTFTFASVYPSGTYILVY